ncbi:MAG: DUF2087 domain-containing protein [Calditrichaeota bacterium]|nr:MAG: DUF2087 domain-containing protein [Calditrichota bacterium]
MNYRDGIIKETEFLTTAELADKLKMNVQVITRKVQSGEIEAYKIGKDWRIPEHAVFNWLESHSNKHKKSKSKTITTSEVLKVTEQLPTQPSKRKFLLEYILTNFEPNKVYSEHEVDSIITRYHKDSKAVRQEFLSEKMMDEINGQYRRSPEYRLSDR